MQLNSRLNMIPAARPGHSVPSRVNSGMPRQRHQPATMIAATRERRAACVSGGMSWIASFTATWLKPQDKHSSTVSAMATASSGRVVWWSDAAIFKRPS
jgi:hypothetical protein